MNVIYQLLPTPTQKKKKKKKKTSQNHNFKFLLCKIKPVSPTTIIL